MWLKLLLLLLLLQLLIKQSAIRLCHLLRALSLDSVLWLGSHGSLHMLDVHGVLLLEVLLVLPLSNAAEGTNTLGYSLVLRCLLEVHEILGSRCKTILLLEGRVVTRLPTKSPIIEEVILDGLRWL